MTTVHVWDSVKQDRMIHHNEFVCTIEQPWVDSIATEVVYHKDFEAIDSDKGRVFVCRGCRLRFVEHQ